MILSNLHIIPEHNEILDYVGELWIIFVMFALWFDKDLHNFIKGITRSRWVAIIWWVFPFIAWYFSAVFLWFWYTAAMIWWLTMTSTSITIAMMSLRNQRLSNSTAATWVMTAAVIENILSLIWLAIVIPIAIASSWDNALWTNDIIISSIFIVLKVIAFFSIVIFIRLFVLRDKESQYMLGKSLWLKNLFNISNIFFKKIWITKIFAMYQWEFAPLVLLTVAMLMGVLAEYFWFHSAIWAYIVWLILQKHHFLDKTKEDRWSIYSQTKHVIDHVAFTIFGPIFFVMLWAKIVVSYDILIKILPWVMLLFTSVLILQILSAWLAARFTGKYTWHDSVMIWVWMLWRAGLAFIVLNIAYVQEQIITEEQFFTLVFVTFLLNISVPLLIKWWKPYYNWEKTLKILWVKLSK